MADSMREALEKAFDATSTESTDTGAASPPTGESSAGAAPGGNAPVAAAPVSDAPKASKSPGQAAKEAREAASKPKPAVAKPVAQPAEQSAATQAPAADAPKTRAPGSWTPALREKWGGLPDDVRDHITKREAEITSQLTQSASARKLADNFVQTIRPYEQLIRSSGSSPMQAVKSLMDTAAVLQIGTPAQKVKAAADIIRAYGVDLQMLDQQLSGQVQRQNAPEAQIERLLSQRLAPINQMMQRLQQREQQDSQAVSSEALQTVQQFRDSEEAEFLDDVREEMADLLEVAARRGRAMTLNEAYDIACHQNADIRAIREQRAEAKRIAQGGGGAARARIAAASLPAGAPPAGAGEGPKGNSRRAALEAAWEKHSG